MDVRHFVIIESSHLANGCTIKCGCSGLMLLHALSRLGAILCDVNTMIGFGIRRVNLWPKKHLTPKKNYTKGFLIDFGSFDHA